MRIVFRADASLTIGTGHVMRCLTLAHELKKNGAEIAFSCRSHPGNLIAFIEKSGFQVHAIPLSTAEDPDSTMHAAWLGGHWREDADALLPLVTGADWVVVDHYALDHRFERVMIDSGARVMVVDDLADRKHDCSLLLDQTFNRSLSDYEGLIPDTSRLLCGTGFALLRPEFPAAAPASLERRRGPRDTVRILVTLGGVDADNVTGSILEVLDGLPLPVETNIAVVLGTTAPWGNAVRQQAEAMRYSTQVHQGVSAMAPLMTWADLAIGAAGSTAWERCCLGLPTLMAVLADNQQTIANNLAAAGAAISLGRPTESDFPSRIRDGVLALLGSQDHMLAMTDAARAITDGMGATRVAAAMKELSIQ